jgi:hypothetical protein
MFLILKALKVGINQISDGMESDNNKKKLMSGLILKFEIIGHTRDDGKQ